MNELLAQFENMTLALAKDGKEIKQEITPEQAQEREDKVSELVEKAILTATENFVRDGGDMRNVLKGDIKSKLGKV